MYIQYSREIRDFLPVFQAFRYFLTLLGNHFINIIKVNTNLPQLEIVPEDVDFGDGAGELVIALAMGNPPEVCDWLVIPQRLPVAFFCELTNEVVGVLCRDI